MKHSFEIRMGEHVRAAPTGVEIIVSIEEVTGLKYPDNSLAHPDTWDGYKMVTSHRVILLLVSDGSNCCEDWGMVSSEDDVSTFLGTKLLRIDWTSEGREKKIDVNQISVDEGDVMFVDFVTDGGLFQLAVYNNHNGYYSHTAQLVIDDVVELEEHI